ncbi:MAG: EscU/YscU/HrcU family type III secretion system export apparatus switch protein [Treponema sp.]|nr:EscU/YscU/HrcU family type III secretion system export apparatus switch protein [Treponema sp.]
MKERKLAVALKYPENAYAPFITAKGQGKIAETIIYEAKRNGIKIEENDVLVDILSMQEVGACVPEETWAALAEIFTFILQNQEK